MEFITGGIGDRFILGKMAMPARRRVAHTHKSGPELFVVCTSRNCWMCDVFRPLLGVCSGFRDFISHQHIEMKHPSFGNQSNRSPHKC